MKKFAITLVGLAAIGIIIGLVLQTPPSPAPPDPAPADGSITVVTSILPQVYFVERIGGDRVDVQALVTPGSSPATYEPTPRQMVALSRAHLFLRIGVPFENALLPRIQDVSPGRIIDTREGITLRGHDPHIWLSPRLVKTQAHTIAAALIAVDPAGRERYETNLHAFLRDLDDIDARLQQALAPVQGKTFMVFHPAWGYFAADYGLHQESIELEGKEPSGRQMTRMIERARAEDVHVIFVQPQFDQNSAAQVATAIGGVVLPIDPLAPDYLANLERVATAIETALRLQQPRAESP